MRAGVFIQQYNLYKILVAELYSAQTHLLELGVVSTYIFIDRTISMLILLIRRVHSRPGETCCFPQVRPYFVVK